MTNHDRWRLYTSHLPSPDSYVDFSFYYLISSALQRRVWFGTNSPVDPHALFTNIYVFLVGPPGIGKGVIIKPMTELLRNYCVDYSSPDANGSPKIYELGDTKLGEEQTSKHLYLLPTLPESTTFEDLVRNMANSTRRVRLPADSAGVRGLYVHNSAYFSLEELSSLFKKHTEDIVNFLLQAYDCGDYTRSTKTQGVDKIKKCCLNIIAGTTPAYLDEVFTEKILSDGFSSRCFFIYEFVNRFRVWNFSELTQAQITARKELLNHVRGLSALYGKLTFSPDAEEFMKQWWESGDHRINTNSRLEAYYARKGQHAKKMAMIKHCAELDFNNISWEISLDTAQDALKCLDAVESRMHYALNFGRRNPFASLGEKVVDYLVRTRKPVSFAELMKEFWGDMREIELQEVLKFLQQSEKVQFENNAYIITKGKLPALKSQGGRGGRAGGITEEDWNNLKAQPLDNGEQPK